ncbi:hypothetical protein RRG08_050181 [Elysia crispata]|uniref:Uncharacterized protein n=1 Tax=Elysia crispata TaxID=231223 RepID=A0AAE1DAZ6_9GAST|nr:hypothetical protein RRG08_050181 [Elysia crispata]
MFLTIRGVYLPLDARQVRESRARDTDELRETLQPQNKLCIIVGAVTTPTQRISTFISSSSTMPSYDGTDVTFKHTTIHHKNPRITSRL